MAREKLKWEIFNYNKCYTCVIHPYPCSQEPKLPCICSRSLTHDSLWISESRFLQHNCMFLFSSLISLWHACKVISWQLCSTGIQANGLKKNIFGKPSPYVKLSIMPSRRHLRSWKQHHGQIAKTSSQTNTINPKWSSEVSSCTALRLFGRKCTILP